MKSSTIINKQLLKYLIGFITIALSIQFIKKINWKVNKGAYDSWNWMEFFIYEFFSEWIIVVLFMIAINYLINKIIYKKIDLKFMFLLHVFLSFLLGFLTLCFITSIAYVLGFHNFNEAIENVSLNNFLSGVDKDFLIYFSSIAIIYVYNYINKIKDVELQKSQLQTQLATSKLQILRSQLHPHFMFNTLNSISSLIDIDVEKSQNLIANFGDLFRGLIEYNEEAMIPLHKELEFLDKYIDIISVRFSDHLIIHKNIDTHLKNELIPSMLIQPIVENAVKHGYSYNITELIIEFSIYRKNNYLFINIENNGELLLADFKTLLSKGTGLKITHERLKSLYENDFEFIIENKKDNLGVISCIKIPCAI